MNWLRNLFTRKTCYNCTHMKFTAIYWCEVKYQSILVYDDKKCKCKYWRKR